MASFENTVTIRRPVVEVFAFLADFDNVPVWNDAISETRKVSPYVGQSVVPPAQRLRQHKDGYRASRYVRRYGKHLRPRLYRRLNPMATRDQAVAMEQELARRLRNRGYTVYGGH